MLKLRLLAPLAGLLAITIFTTAYLFRRQRCHIVYEKAAHLVVKVIVVFCSATLYTCLVFIVASVQFQNRLFRTFRDR